MAARHTTTAPVRLVSAATAAVALLSLTIESGQFFVSGRIVSPQDLLLNIVGAAFIAWLVHALQRGGVQARAIRTFTVRATFASVVFLLGHGWLSMRRGFEVRGWQPDYGVAAGDEVDGSRPYVGSVWEPQICAGQGSTRVCLTAGASHSERARLSQVAEVSQIVELSAVVLSESDAQSGPARIVTFSLDPAYRNATLAQDGRSLILRIRTPQTGPNGADPQFSLPNAVPDGQLTRVTAVFERGHLTLISWSEGAYKASTFEPGPFTGWVTSMPLKTLEPRHIFRARLVAAVVVFIGLGLVLGQMTHRRIGFGIGLSGVIGGVLWALQGNLDGSRVSQTLASALLLALGFALATWDRRLAGFE
jgi:hypothetical protein